MTGRNKDEAAGLGSASRSFSSRRRRAVDRAARWFVTGGGFAIIASIAAILIFISYEVSPLAGGAGAVLDRRFAVSDALQGEEERSPEVHAVVAVGIDEYREVAWFVTDRGNVTFVSLVDRAPLAVRPLEAMAGRKITAVETSADMKRYAFGLSDGSLLTAGIGITVSYREGDRRVLTPKVTAGKTMKTGTSALRRVSWREPDEEGVLAAAITEGGKLLLLIQEVEESLFGEGEVRETRFDLSADLGGRRPLEAVIDGRGQNLFVAVAGGGMFRWKLSGAERPFPSEMTAGDGMSGDVSALDMLAGGRSLAAGGTDGSVTVWFETRSRDGEKAKKMTPVHHLAPMPQGVSALATTVRNRGLLTGDGDGNISLHYVTTRHKLLDLQSPAGAVEHLAFAPKGDGVIALDAGGVFSSWSLDNPHPELTWKALFGKLWYEGYDKPEYVWQSTGLEDDFEPKLSLVPLIFGTVKGTFYALLFAVPIAILGALCVSQFMHRTLRNTVKPILETMAALPSVVLGFVAGLWLAPLLESKAPAMILLPPVLLALTLLVLASWKALPRRLRSRTRDGAELFLLVPAYIGGILFCLWLNDPIESAFFQGEFSFWLYKALGLSYDQRNSLIVGFAMGFAVIPIIFSISEDALSNVPRHLVSGSLALGATRWQTAVGVVLPTASAGIFSAVMIGLGRAVGETMIVLMATGNTPVMDWNIFNGFRALSANIAVEIPEAPHGGTLYRVLFLAALLLFAITFFINTAAEIVRIRLRKKYGQL